MDNCYKHLNTEATHTCTNCHRHFCSQCYHDYQGKPFCSFFCISQHKVKQRTHLLNYMTSMKAGVVYWGFFILALYVMYVFYKFQNLPFTRENIIHDILPYVIIYIALGVILGIAFMVVSFYNAHKS